VKPYLETTRCSKLFNGKCSKVLDGYTVEAKLTHIGTEHVTEGLVKAIMVKFQKAFKQAITKEQRKQLLHLLIDEITIDANKKVESIRIKLSTEVAKHLLITEEGESSYLDDFSFSFCVYLVV